MPLAQAERAHARLGCLADAVAAGRMTLREAFRRCDAVTRSLPVRR